MVLGPRLGQSVPRDLVDRAPPWRSLCGSGASCGGTRSVRKASRENDLSHMRLAGNASMDILELTAS